MYLSKWLMKSIRNQEQREVKLNIGCGPTGQIKGFDNLDNSPSVLLSRIPVLKMALYKLSIINKHQYKADWSGVIRCDVGRRLPYRNEKVDKIYTSHFLEHIPQKKGVRFLWECHRVLKKDGIMRLVVPDLLWHAERYVEGTKALMEESALPYDREAHDTFLKTIYGAYLTHKWYGAEHRYMYDFPTLVSILKEIGFKRILKYDYQEGEDEELATYDSRPEDSLHLEFLK